MANEASVSWNQFPHRVALFNIFKNYSIKLPDHPSSADVLVALTQLTPSTQLKSRHAKLAAQALSYFSADIPPDSQLAGLVRGFSEDPPSPVLMDTLQRARKFIGQEYLTPLSDQQVTLRLATLPAEPPPAVVARAKDRGTTPMRRIFIGPNRGEIVLRGIRAVRELSFELGYKIETVVMVGAGDEGSEFLRYADHRFSVPWGKNEKGEPVVPYTNMTAIMSSLDEFKARGREVDTVFPGYGFLSENSAFAQALEERGITLIGPPASAMRALGSKTQAKAIMRVVGMPMAEGTGDIPLDVAGRPDMAWVRQEVEKIGLPVIVKPSDGGGGKGMVVVRDVSDLENVITEAMRLSEKFFSSNRIALEKYVEDAQHIEVQVLSDGSGNKEGVFICGSRNCSSQRRYQKYLEESYPGMIDPGNWALITQAIRSSFAQLGYRGPATVEFLRKDGVYYFMEVNTRLQVEATVTEQRAQIDLLKEALRLRSGQGASASFLRRMNEPESGLVTLQVRLQAEDPFNPEMPFQPSAGTLRKFRMPAGPHIRVDTVYKAGDKISADYDNLLAKIIVTAPTRAEALAIMERALGELSVAGVNTNQEFLLEMLRTSQAREYNGKALNIDFTGRYLAARLHHKTGVELDIALKRVFGFKAEDQLLGADRHKAVALELINEYQDSWSQPKPLLDEAIIGALVAAYKMNRARIEKNLLTVNPRESLIAANLPTMTGFSTKVEVYGQKLDVNVRELSFGELAITVAGQTVFVSGSREIGDSYHIKMHESDKATSQYVMDIDADQGVFKVNLNGTSHQIRVLSASVSENQGEMMAAMPSAVIKVYFREGDRVIKGEKGADTEAMKMPMPILAPCDGIVEKVLIKSGDRLNPGQVMFRIKPADEANADEANKDAGTQKVGPVFKFMDKQTSGPRARLALVADDDETAIAEITRVISLRLDQDAHRLVEYIGQYLIGYDYTQGHLNRILNVLDLVRVGSLSADAINKVDKALVQVLQQYLEVLKLYEEEPSGHRSALKSYAKHWREESYKVPKAFRSILAKNLAHYDIDAGANGEKIAIPPPQEIRHKYSNAILRMLQSWTEGDLRQKTVARLIGLVGRLKLNSPEILLGIRELYRISKERSYDSLTAGCRDVARNSDPKLLMDIYDDIHLKTLPTEYISRLSDDNADPFSEIGTLSPTVLGNIKQRMLASLESPLYQDIGEIEEGTVKQLALARRAERVAELESPIAGIRVFLFQQNGSHSLQVFTQFTPDLSLAILGGRAVAAYEIENRLIMAMQVAAMYDQLDQTRLINNSKAGRLIGQKGHVILEMSGEIIWSAEDRGQLCLPALRRIGSRILPFASGRNILSTVFLAHEIKDGARQDHVFEFSAAYRTHDLIVRHETPQEFVVPRSERDAIQHSRGKLTVRERASAFFDGGVSEVITVPGINDEGRVVNGFLIKGKVEGRECVGYFSDFTQLGGAVGNLEGQLMVAAGLYSLLKGVPLIWFNDSAGANVKEGVVSLNRSAEDFMMKRLMTGAHSSSDIARYISNHPDQELFQRLIKELGDGRPLVDQLANKAGVPPSIALMVGGNSGMVVYGPALQDFVFMVDGPEVYGVLTGSEVVYEATSEIETNTNMGGATALGHIAGTVVEVVNSERAIMALARRALTFLQPDPNKFSHEIVRSTPLDRESHDEEEILGRVISAQRLKENIDAGTLWHFKEKFRNSGSALTTFASLGGHPVAILGPLSHEGFGTKQAVRKATDFMQAARNRLVPLIRIVGRHWFDQQASGSGRVKERMTDNNETMGGSKSPQIAIVMDAKGLASMPATSGNDVVIFVKDSRTTADVLAQAMARNCIIVESFASAMDKAACYVHLISATGDAALRVRTTDPASRKTPKLLEAVPTDLYASCDMHKVIKEVVDDGRYLEFGGGTDDEKKPDASNQILALASLNGRVIGIIADQPMVKAGAASNEEALKYKSFVEFCERRRIPIWDANDSPGFLPGRKQEGANIQKVWAEALAANIRSTMPRVSTTLRKNFGGRFIVAGHKYLRPGIVSLVNDRGMIAVMGKRGGMQFSPFRKEYLALQISLPESLSALIKVLKASALPADCVEPIEVLASGISSLKRKFPFKEEDVVKRFLKEEAVQAFLKPLAEEFIQQEVAISPIAQALKQVYAELAKSAALQDRYDKEIGDPTLAIKSGAVDRTFNIGNLRAELIQAFDESERLTSSAFDRHWSTITSEEALGIYAVAALRRFGFEPRIVVQDPASQSLDLVALTGVAGTASPQEILDLLASFVASGEEVSQEQQQALIRRYFAADNDIRQELIEESRLSHLNQLVEDTWSTDPALLSEGIIQGALRLAVDGNTRNKQQAFALHQIQGAIFYLGLDASMVEINENQPWEAELAKLAQPFIKEALAIINTLWDQIDTKPEFHTILAWLTAGHRLPREKLLGEENLLIAWIERELTATIGSEQAQKVLKGLKALALVDPEYAETDDEPSVDTRNKANPGGHGATDGDVDKGGALSAYARMTRSIEAPHFSRRHPPLNPLPSREGNLIRATREMMIPKSSLPNAERSITNSQSKSPLPLRPLPAARRSLTLVKVARERTREMGIFSTVTRISPSPTLRAPSPTRGAGGVARLSAMRFRAKF